MEMQGLQTFFHLILIRFFATMCIIYFIIFLPIFTRSIIKQLGKVCDTLIPIKYNVYLWSTLLTRITLQYYWDDFHLGAKDYVYPKGINMHKRERKTKLLKLKTTELETTHTDDKKDWILKKKD